MRRGPLTALLAAVAAVGLVSALLPGAAPAFVIGGSLVVFVAGAIAAFARARALRARAASPFGALVPPDLPAERPADLRSLEWMLGWQQYSAEDFHHRVAPVLTRILGSKLRQHGIDAHAQPAAARRLAGPALHPLLDPPPEREGAVVDTAAIVRMVDAIEAL